MFSLKAPKYFERYLRPQRRWYWDGRSGQDSPTVSFYLSMLPGKKELCCSTLCLLLLSQQELMIKNKKYGLMTKITKNYSDIVFRSLRSIKNIYLNIFR